MSEEIEEYKNALQVLEVERQKRAQREWRAKTRRLTNEILDSGIKIFYFGDF